VVRKKRNYPSKKKDFFSTFDFSSFQEVSVSCPHFSSCGGCSFQNISYSNQLELKKKYLESLGFEDISVVASPQEVYYRNRMDFLFNQGYFCLRQKGAFDKLVPLSLGCLLVPKQFQESLNMIQQLLRDTNLSSYDVVLQEGFLRYVTFRFAVNTNECMVFFSTKTPTKEEDVIFREVLQKVSSLVDSVYWQINDSLTDTSMFPQNPIHLQLNKPFITEKINDLLFSYSPFCFFQNNTLMTQEVITAMRPFVSGQLVDLCCGVGVLGLCLSKYAKNLTGIELVDESILFAKKNASDNSISSCSFFCDDMKHLTDYTPTEINTLLVDPARPGLGNKTISRILNLQPDTIIYLSCNPKTLRSDLFLLENDYEQMYACAFDFFPQTPHIETLVVLKQKL
jgi:23S rRNA (uracil1939-C5)-methyltransferase